MNCWHCHTKLIWGGDHDIEGDKDIASLLIYLVLDVEVM